MITPSELVNIYINTYSDKKILNVGNNQKKPTLDKYALFQGFFREHQIIFRRVWEKYRESDVSKFCKISRASIKGTSRDANIIPKLSGS